MVTMGEKDYNERKHETTIFASADGIFCSLTSNTSFIITVRRIVTKFHRAETIYIMIARKHETSKFIPSLPSF